MPTYTRFRSVKAAVRAAQRLANRTGRPVRVLVQKNPLRRKPYPKKLATKYIRQEFKVEKHKPKARRRSVAQLKAIGIARARAAKRNPRIRSVKYEITPTQRQKALWAQRAQAAYKRGDNATGHLFSAAAALPRGASIGLGRYEDLRKGYAGFKRNPEWLTGAMPRKLGTGHHMTRFYDHGRKLRAEMFEQGGDAPKLLVYNPGRQSRVRATGRYGYSLLERGCMCGHRLGQHTSAAPHECLARCPCAKFRPRVPAKGRKNPEDEIRELMLYIENDGDLYRQRQTPIMKNLARKMVKGTYDPAKATKLWKYLADAGAQKYTREFDAPGPGRTSYGAFSTADRQAVARELSSSFEGMVKRGELDPKKLASRSR